MNNETKKSYASPQLAVYGGVSALTQAGGRGNDAPGDGYNAHGNGHSFGHLSHMPPGNPGNNAPGQHAKGGGPRR